MDIVRAVTGSLDVRSVQSLIDPLIAGISTRDETSDRRCIVLDLSAVSFVTPAPIVTLASILSVSTKPSAARLIVPTDISCRQYLAAAGFLQVAATQIEVVGADGLEEAEASTADTVLQLTCLGSSAEIPDLCRLVEVRIDQMLGHGDESWNRTKAPIISTVREICDNVFQHAGGTPGWIAAQRYTNRSQGTRYVEIAISDAGRGIRRSLATAHTELLQSTDSAALVRMLREHLSRRSNAQGGTGYFVLQKATKDLDGSFHLRSGTGILDRPRRGGLQHRDELAAWPGTHLLVRLSCA